MIDKLSPAQAERYHRQMIIPQIGEEGQRALLSKTVTVIGTGGLGSPLCLYLAAAGVGNLRIIDNDTVSLSNLQRQVLYSNSDLGVDKVKAAQRRLNGLNDDINITPLNERVTPENLLGIVQDSDVLVDCSDNFATKYLVNATAIQLGIPAVIAGVQDFQGQIIVVKPGETACYHCVFGKPPKEAPPENRAPLPIIGFTAGVFGCLEASEVVKLLLGVGKSLAGTLLMMDLQSADFLKVAVKRNPACPVCGNL